MHGHKTEIGCIGLFFTGQCIIANAFFNLVPIEALMGLGIIFSSLILYGLRWRLGSDMKESIRDTKDFNKSLEGFDNNVKALTTKVKKAVIRSE